MDKESLLRKIDCVSFMLTDLGLYLDTHPNDIKAAHAFRNYRKERKELLNEFETNFYPLTMDCHCCDSSSEQPSDDSINQKACECIWCWGKGSEPWKGCCEPEQKA